MTPGSGSGGVDRPGSLPVLVLSGLDERRRETLRTRAVARLDDPTPAVAAALAAIRAEGDAAVVRLLREIDRVDIPVDRLVVDAEAAAAAVAGLAPALRTAMERTVGNLERFHAAQLPAPWELEVEPGVMIGERFPAVASAGVYVPFGKAVYPSSALMLTVPARVAGVPRIVLASGVDPATGEIPPAVLDAAAIGGATELWRVSGTPAVGAFAYGTARLRPVDVIAGPGGPYVEAAKRLVRGVVGVDLDAGPSEVLVLAPGTPDPDLVAADLLSEAEHGPDSSAIAVVTDDVVAAAVAVAVTERLARLPAVRADYVHRQAADGRSAIVVAADEDGAVAFAEEIASEHVIVHAADADRVASRLRRAGTVCIGPWTPSPVGSYVAGTNHVLPTGGSARYAGGLAATTFLRRQSFERLTADGLAALRPAVAAYAEAEGLPAHLAAVDARLEGRRR